MGTRQLVQGRIRSGYYKPGMKIRRAQWNTLKNLGHDPKGMGLILQKFGVHHSTGMVMQGGGGAPSGSSSGWNPAGGGPQAGSVATTEEQIREFKPAGGGLRAGSVATAGDYVREMRARKISTSQGQYDFIMTHSEEARKTEGQLQKEQNVMLAYPSAKRQQSQPKETSPPDRWGAASEEAYKAPPFLSLSRLNIFQDKMQYKSDASKGINRQMYGVLGIGAAALHTGGTIVRHPLRTAKEIVWDLPKGLLTDLKTGEFKTGYSIGRGIKQNPSQFVGSIMGSYGGFKTMGFLARKFGAPAWVKARTELDPRTVKVKETGVTFVEAHTVSTPVNQLLKFEGKTVKTTHVTTKNPFKQKGKIFSSDSFVVEAKPEGAGKFRSQHELYHFYKSTPESTGARGRAYLGYAGILGGGKSAGEVKSVLKKPTIHVLEFTDPIKPSKKTGSLAEINLWQGKQSGATMVPSENIKSLSLEGQVISPAKYKDIVKGFDFEGSIIERAGKSRYTFYPEKLSNPYPKGSLRGKAWDLLGVKTKFHKVKITPVKTKPVKGEVFSTVKTAPLKKALGGRGKLKITDSYYGPKKYKTPNYAKIASICRVLRSSKGRTSSPGRHRTSHGSGVSKISRALSSPSLSKVLSSPKGMSQPKPRGRGYLSPFSSGGGTTSRITDPVLSKRGGSYTTPKTTPLHPSVFGRTKKIPKFDWDKISESRHPKTKGKSILSRRFKYTPNLASVHKKIKGKRPGLLTGLEGRPI